MLTKSLFIRLFIRKPCGKFEIIIITEKYGVVWNGAEESGQGAIYKERHFDIGQEVSNTELCHQFNCKRIGKIRESRDTKDIVIIANYSKKERDKWRGETLFVRGAKIPKYQNVPGAKNNILQRKLRENRNVYLFEAIDKERYLYCGRIELAGDPFMQTRRGRDGIILYKRIFPMRLIPENNLETLQ